jgi:protein MpaA
MLRRGVPLTAVALLLLVSSGAALAATPPAPPTTENPGAVLEHVVERIGTTASGTPITVTRRGRADATIDVLVVGIIHGNETAGLAVIRRLARTAPPARIRWWLLPSLNPDGQRRAVRQNGRGVDLNRNFPFEWRAVGRPWDTYYPGRARASERETRALQALVRRMRPDLTLWYHQHAALIDQPRARWRAALARTYARASGLPLRGGVFGRLYGTATSWQHDEQPRSAAFVVELPAGQLSGRSVLRHVEAVRRTSNAAAFDDVVAD